MRALKCWTVDRVPVGRVLWLISGSPIPSQEMNPAARAKALGHLVPRVEGTAWGWLHRAATTFSSWQWKDHEPVSHTLKTWPTGLVTNWTNTFCFLLWNLYFLQASQSIITSTLKEKNLYFVLLHGFRWKACKRVTWTSNILKFVGSSHKSDSCAVSKSKLGYY